MLDINHEIIFTFFDVSGGDAIWIRYIGTDEVWHNVLIDGGYGKDYKTAFGPLIKHLRHENEMIDLWVITHIDRDHIGAVLGFVRDKNITAKNKSVKEFWFNHSDETVKDPNGKLGVGDGIEFRTYLTDKGLLSKDAITTMLPPADLFGLVISVVSPTPEKLAIADNLWKVEEKSGKIGRSIGSADHSKSIEELKGLAFRGDSDPANGSSIALLVTFKTINTLLLADSHPEVIQSTLCRLGYSKNNPLNVHFMQLAHHGSKANTSPDLLEMINTNNYIITGNGIHNRHPDKETLVRILFKKRNDPKPIEFHFPCNTKELSNMFLSDQNPFERFNFVCNYHNSAFGTSFKYLPKID